MAIDERSITAAQDALHQGVRREPAQGERRGRLKPLIQWYRRRLEEQRRAVAEHSSTGDEPLYGLRDPLL